MPDQPTPYWDYIEIEALLSLQKGIAEGESDLSNDEVMFIVVHQIDELWFKLVLREMVAVRDLFAHPPVPEQSLASAVRGIRRMQEILRQLAAHFALMETMTTRDYLAFREKLAGASGFQSGQLREIEILMGLQPAERLPLGHEGSYLAALREHDGSESPTYRRVAARLTDRPTLRDAMFDWLHRTPIQGSTPAHGDDAERVAAFIEQYLACHRKAVERGVELARAQSLTGGDLARLEERARNEVAYARTFLTGAELPEPERAGASRVRAALVFIESYRELPLLAWPREVLEGITSFEQAFVIFRQRHARMVERMIGRRTGTGGSSGVDYLDATALEYRVFRELWAVRTILVRAADLPPLEGRELYGFAGGT
jgi:tryptophan 2,3-dioxygenase